MPHLTQPISPGGPIVSLHLGASLQRQTAIKAAGQPIPPIVKVNALIDTGASGTVIEEKVLHQLGLTPTGAINIFTPSTKGTPVTCMTYDVFLGLYHPTFSLLNGNFPVVASDFSGQSIQALIGRDLLKQCVLIYNGDNNTFTLGF